MPYSDRWGLTATKLGAGLFRVSTPDGTRSVDVAVNQVMADDLVNVGYCLHRAIVALWPDLPDPWRSRFDYAVARWKLDAYQSTINGLPQNQRAPWRAKRDVWVAEEARLKTLMGADA